ncbi:MAG: hypothetical protein KY395_02105 [Actinobacteria bacterium]|nr:hypothetical protein [Actinomycetota bacterium]
MAERTRRSNAAVWAALVIGLGLVAAPAVFGMFSRAPAGGQMIDEFAPYMRGGTLRSFDADLAVIDAAYKETKALPPEGSASSLATFEQQWPRIHDEMATMLSTIEANVGRFNGLRALPPFWAFPWFFVLPGLMIAGIGLWTGRSVGSQRERSRWALVVVAVSVIAAPAVFQMFGRAPAGAAMIDDFRPLMTEANIAQIQGDFLVIASAEGQLRTDVLARSAPDSLVQLPATRKFVTEWPRIAAEMAPMIGAMADNLDNFAAVDALPAFWLFPWFFVFPGLLVAALGLAARPSRPADVAPSPIPAAAPVLRSTT